MMVPFAILTVDLAGHLLLHALPRLLPAPKNWLCHWLQEDKAFSQAIDAGQMVDIWALEKADAADAWHGKRSEP